jgi:hypothetical protein
MTQLVTASGLALPTWRHALLSRPDAVRRVRLPCTATTC